MTLPDWIKAAAEEIGERDAFVEWFEQINLPNRGAEIAEKIIRKHCPMEPGVAYMPVPRCETCRWWDVTVASEEGQGVCLSKTFPREPGSATVTEPDFGCVQWEEAGTMRGAGI